MTRKRRSPDGFTDSVESNSQCSPSSKLKIQSPSNIRPTTTLRQAVDVLAEEGFSNYSLGNFEQAEKLYSQALCCLDASFQRLLAESKMLNPVPPANEKTSEDKVSETDYDEGMRMYNEPIQVGGDKNAYDEDANMLEFMLLFNIGQAHVERKSYEHAIRFFHLALGKSTLLSDTPMIVKTLQILHNLGYCHYRIGKDKLAIIFYQRCLSLISVFGLGTDYQAASLNCIGVLCFNHESRSLDPAMQFFRQSLQLYRTNNQKPEVPSSLSSSEKEVDAVSMRNIATVLNNIGRVYYMQSEFRDALTAYKDSLKLRRQVMQRLEHANDRSRQMLRMDVAATIYNIGQTYSQMGRADESLAHYHDFLHVVSIGTPLKTKDNSEGPPQEKASATPPNILADVALVYKGIAEVYHLHRSDYPMALSYYMQALEIEKTFRGKYHAKVSNTLNNLGNLSYEMKDFETALEFYKEGLSIEQAILPPNHPHILVTLTNIAHIHKHLEEHAPALKAYQQVLQMQRERICCCVSGGNNKKEENIKKEDLMELAETWSSVGLMQYHLEDYASSFDSYQESLRIRRSCLEGEDHPMIASTLNSIGLVLFKQDLYSLATECFCEALRIRCHVLGKNHRDVAISWYNLAAVYFETGREELAIHLYQETLRVEQHALGSQHPDVVLTILHLGQVHQHLGQLEEAIKFFRQAVDIEKRRGKGSKDRKSLRRALNLLGNAYLQLGQTAPMMECFIEASRLWEARRNERPAQGEGRAASDGSSEVLVIAGFNLYGLSKTLPPSAPAA